MSSSNSLVSRASSTSPHEVSIREPERVQEELKTLKSYNHMVTNEQGSYTCRPIGVQDFRPNFHDQIFCEISV